MTALVARGLAAVHSALASYPGTLLLVTHDWRMLNAVATNRQVEAADGRGAAR